MSPILENKTIDELVVGQQAQYSKTLTEEDIRLFAKTSGDINPVHLDPEYAKGTAFGQRIGHGMWSGALVSAAIATLLPGPGSVYRSQSLKFLKPAYIGDTLTVMLEITAIKERLSLITLDCTVINQDQVKIATGSAEVIAPKDKIRLEVSAPD